MKQSKTKYQASLLELVGQYEVMSQKGTVSFLEETVFLDLVSYYENEGYVEQAIATCALALEQHPFSFELYVTQAQLLHQHGLSDEALVALDIAALYAPEYKEVQLMRVEIMAELGQIDAALAYLEEIKSNANKEVFAACCVAEASIHCDLLDYEKTFTLLCAALRNDPYNTEALTRMWVMTEATHRFHESVKVHERLINITPYSHLAWFNLGHAQMSLFDYESALDSLQMAYFIKDDFEIAYRDRAELLIQLCKYDQAIDCYNDLIQIQNFMPDAEMLYSMGYCHEYLHDYASARNYYSKALVDDEYYDEAMFRMGETFARTKDWRKAIAWYRKAIVLDKRREDYYAALAYACKEMGQIEKARVYYARATEIAPDEPSYWIKYICFLMDIREYDEAMSVLEESDNYTYGTEVVYCRCAVLFQMGKRHEALYRLTDALEEDFEMHSLLFSYAPIMEADDEVQIMIESYRN